MSNAQPYALYKELKKIFFYLRHEALNSDFPTALVYPLHPKNINAAFTKNVTS